MGPVEEKKTQVVVVLTSGKADNGKQATLAFSCGMSALALGYEATVFLTSDAAIWGYDGTANGITVQGFPPLAELIDAFSQAGGQILLCSVCHQTCSIGNSSILASQKRADTSIAGFATIIERSIGGSCITF